MLKKVLGFYTKYFAIWVILFGAVAYLYPGPFVVLKPGMDWFFALTMFGIGVVLQVQDFKRIAQRPVIVLIGSAAQFTIMPLGAFALAKLLNLPPEIDIDRLGTRGNGQQCDVLRRQGRYGIFSFTDNRFNAAVPGTDSGADSSFGRFYPGSPLLEYADTCNAYGSCSFIYRIRGAALLQRESREDSAGLSRNISDIYYLYLFAGHCSEQGKSCRGDRHNINGSDCLKYLRDADRIRYRHGFSDEFTPEANPGDCDWEAKCRARNDPGIDTFRQAGGNAGSLAENARRTISRINS